MPGRRAAPPPPILKQDLAAATQQPQDVLPFTSCTSIHSTRVHFPPTPKLTCRELTYPSHAYDRAPIVVAQNTCAMPSRGAREYHAPADDDCRARSRKPRFAPAPSHQSATTPSSSNMLPNCYFPAVPASAPADMLAWSSSSESDDSDTAGTPPPAADAHGASHPTGPAALAFLPHAPAPPSPKEKRRRSATPCRARRAAKPVSFASPSCFGDDGGCLGGF